MRICCASPFTLVGVKQHHAVLQRIHLARRSPHALPDIPVIVVGQQVHSVSDPCLLEKAVAVAGGVTVALVFDPRERVDGPHTVDAHAAVGVREVRKPGL